MKKFLVAILLAGIFFRDPPPKAESIKTQSSTSNFSHRVGEKRRLVEYEIEHQFDSIGHQFAPVL